jgi:hypothetical protein
VKREGEGDWADNKMLDRRAVGVGFDLPIGSFCGGLPRALINPRLSQEAASLLPVITRYDPPHKLIE